MAKEVKETSAPKKCGECGLAHMLMTGYNEYTCYTCGHVMRVKTNKQSKL